MCKNMRHSGDFDLATLARRCNGYVGADLAALCKEAAVVAVNRIFGSLFGVKGESARLAHVVACKQDTASSPHLPDSSTAAVDESTAAGASKPTPGAACAGGVDALAGGGESVPGGDGNAGSQGDAGAPAPSLRDPRQPLSSEELAPLAVCMGDFEVGLTKVQPSAKREGFATVPDVSWDDVGALSELRAELHMAICQPILTPERFEALGLKASCGVLLHGPPAVTAN